MKICVATGNQGKLLEIKAMLSGLPVQLVTLKDIGLSLDVEETGSTYEENAYLKASAHAAASGMLSLGDDSGLEVAVLNGEPGLRSNRYAPLPNPTDQDRRQYLLSVLNGKPEPWSAFFTCTICLCQPDGKHTFFYGRCYGKIIPLERGTNGFGYDPIFQLEGSDTTMAELSDEEKNKISHRARAMQNALPAIEKLIRGSGE